MTGQGHSPLQAGDWPLKQNRKRKLCHGWNWQGKNLDFEKNSDLKLLVFHNLTLKSSYIYGYYTGQFFSNLTTKRQIKTYLVMTMMIGLNQLEI